jgi:hypothetical protein
MTPDEIFNKAWDILVEHAGASKDPMWRPIFVDYFVSSRSHAEFHFGGYLGFGGKFWRNDGHYYLQDGTAPSSKSAAVVIEVNKLLAELPYFEPQPG